uniref:Uncharacterized protein n=1 Tax=Octopus bimaculoides TaxID=37653 RepID=A0A0L8G6D1_OCTBM
MMFVIPSEVDFLKNIYGPSLEILPSKYRENFIAQANYVCCGSSVRPLGERMVTVWHIISGTEL